MINLDDYYTKFDDIDINIKHSFEYILSRINGWSSVITKYYRKQFLFQGMLAGLRKLTPLDVINEELFNQSKIIADIDLYVDWDILSAELKEIMSEVFSPENIDGEVIIDHYETGQIFILNILAGAGLDEEYLYAKVNSNDTDIGLQQIYKLEQSSEIVELVGRFRWMVHLINLLPIAHSKKGVDIPRKLPSLPESLLDKDDFNRYFKIPQVMDIYDVNEKGQYFLKQGKKAHLAGVAHNLKNRGKLIESLKTSQDLAKVFCSFFHVSYNKDVEKQFQPDRAKIYEFNFIK